MALGVRTIPATAAVALVWLTGVGTAAGPRLGFAKEEPDGLVGAARCGSCHEFAYSVWAQGPHAEAHQSLVDAERQDPKCTACHAASVVPDIAVRFAGVQCETCHGDGHLYQAEYVMRDHDLSRLLGLVDPTEVTCLRCHGEGSPAIGPFDFQKAWARIAHDEAARQKWEAAKKVAP